MDSKELAEKAKSILEGRKGREIVVIDTSKQTIITDYFIICSGTSTTHLRGLSDEVEEKFLNGGRQCAHKEGYDSAKWILLDYTDIVIHLFLEEERAYYNLERLWRDGVKPSSNIIK